MSNYLDKATAKVMNKYIKHPLIYQKFTADNRPPDSEIVLVKYSDNSVRRVYFIYWMADVHTERFDYRDVDAVTHRVVNRPFDCIPTGWYTIPEDLYNIFYTGA